METETQNIYPTFCLRVISYKNCLRYQKQIMAIVYNKLSRLVLELDPNMHCNDLLSLRDQAYETRKALSNVTMDWNKYLHAGLRIERFKEIYRSELNTFHDFIYRYDRVVRAHIEKMADFTVKLNGADYNIKNPVRAEKYPNVPEFDPLQGIPEINYYRTPPAL